MIEGEFTLGNNEIVQISYEGIVNESDQREKRVEINPALTKGELIFYGDIYCLLYTSDADDDQLCVDIGGRRIIKKKNTSQNELLLDYCADKLPKQSNPD